jgi:hypothetical protein
VHWPSGAVDKVSDAGVNKILIIKEGQGVVEQKDFKHGAQSFQNRER